MSGQNWRTAVDASDYFGHQQKSVNLEQRRPVLRRASDFVGPGISGSAVRVTDFNDVLATFNGFFSAAPGAFNAPSPDEAFIGTTVGDSVLGGFQKVTGLVTGFEFTRTFARNLSDPSSLLWGEWRNSERVPASATRRTFAKVTNVSDQSGGTQLYSPEISTLGTEGTYDRGDKDIFVLRSGVYTGFLRVAGPEIPTKVTAIWPDQSGTKTTIITPPNGRVSLPFTFWTDATSQEIRVSVSHEGTGDQPFYWDDFAITRVGDIE